MKASHRYNHLSHEAGLVVADCNGDGQITKQYCLLEKLIFTSSTNDHLQQTWLTCSCIHAKEQRDRLSSTSSIIAEDFDEFVRRDQTLYCIHAATAFKLASSDFNPKSIPVHSITDDEHNVFVDLLSTSPFLAACYSGSFGLISRHKVGNSYKFICQQCSFQSCLHVSAFTEWCISHGLTEDLAPQVFGSDDNDSHTAVSSKSIPYPLTDQLKYKHDQIEAGEIQFPLCLVPAVDDGAVCSHGNR